VRENVVTQSGVKEGGRKCKSGAAEVKRLVTVEDRPKNCRAPGPGQWENAEKGKKGGVRRTKSKHPKEIKRQEPS